MSAAAISHSSLTTSLARYFRSWGLWALLLIAPIAARFMIGDGAGVIVAVGGRLPEMTSAFLGVSLGVVVATLLSPVAWIYLRSNTTRRQPWQVEEVTAAPRVPIALGRFAADSAVMMTTLAALTLAGWLLGWFVLPAGEFNILHITFALWIVAAPVLIVLAALRILFDARPLLRSGFGDFLYFVFWVTTMAAPLAMQGQPPSLSTNMTDFAGYTAPLLYGAPEDLGSFAVSIGWSFVQPGHIQLDVLAGLFSPGYIESRFVWIAIAIILAMIAGLIYRPHVARHKGRQADRAAAAAARPKPARAPIEAPPAGKAALAPLNLVWAEAKLIASGRLFLPTAIAVAIAAFLVDFRHMASPAALLPLVFGLTAHAGRSEARGLRPLAIVAPLSPMLRRVAFVVASTGWSLLMAAPALVRNPPLEILGLAMATGAGAGLIATALATLSGSSFAPRVVLLILWYAYLST